MLLEVSLQANYCIQVLTVDQGKLHSIIAKASSKNYVNFNDVRVERRGHYFVFRIGDYERYKDAKKEITDIREITRDAYIRKCDFVKEKAVFIANEREEHYHEEPRKELSIQYEKPKIIVRKSIVHNIQKKEQKRREYKRRGELISPYKKEDSLWNECKKCFVPVYEDEEDEDDVHSSDDIQKKSRKIQVKKNISKQESFWAEDIPANKISTQKHNIKHNNKFNIDEQFLP